MRKLKLSQTIFLYLSIAVYLISLTQKSYCTPGQCENFSGLLDLIFGWFGVFMGHLPAFPWLANPLLFISWRLYRKKSKTTFILSMCTFILMLSFLFADKIIVNDGSTQAIILSYGLGYWLWVLSSLVLLIGNILNLKKLNTKPQQRTELKGK